MTTRSGSISKRSSLINGLEERLSSTFKPVKPDGDFVKRLKVRLASTPSLRIEEDRTSGILLCFLGILAVLAGLL
ncbi:MAG: hypothetical protein WBV22_01280, partial [Anaerolineaceae bacterium]